MLDAARVNYRAQKSRLNNLIILVLIYYGLTKLKRNPLSRHLIQKRKEAVSTVHCWVTHYELNKKKNPTPFIAL